MSLSRILKSRQVRLKDSSILDEGNGVASTISLDATSTYEEYKKTKQEIDHLRAWAKKEVQNILEEARQEADLIKEQAIKDAESHTEEEKQKAREVGRQEGREEIIKGWSDLLAGAEKQLQAVAADLEAWQSSLPEEVLGLSEQIACRLVGAELKVNPQAIVNRVARALQEITNAQEVLVKVAPANFSILEEAKEELQRLNGGLRLIRFVANEELTEGDFIIETDFGGINGRLETQLELIHKELLERCEWGDTQT